MRHQDGYIWKKSRAWYGRWREDVLVDGRILRRQRCRKLADYGDRFRCERDVRPLLDDLLKPINEGRTTPDSTLSVEQFVEQHYLPAMQKALKPSTYNGYRHIYEGYLKGRLAVGLRDFRCFHATRLLEEIHRQRGVRRRMLRHIKTFLSAVFSYAKQQGALDGVNPAKDAAIPRDAEGGNGTAAVSLEQMLTQLDALDKAGEWQARTAVALIYWCGLRPGEARGLDWTHYDEQAQRLYIRRSVWGTQVTTPKTNGSAASVPVSETLRAILADQRQRDGNPVGGPILRGSKLGRPVNLNNVARRVVIPVLRKAGVPWHGWYSLRRGIATALDALTKRPTASSVLLRHASLETTVRHYIKPGEAEMVEGLRALDELCNQCATAAVN